MVLSHKATKDEEREGVGQAPGGRSLRVSARRLVGSGGSRPTDTQAGEGVLTYLLGHSVCSQDPQFILISDIKLFTDGQEILLFHYSDQKTSRDTGRANFECNHISFIQVEINPQFCAALRNSQDAGL